MSMEEKTTLDVLRECEYRYISSVLSRPYMEDISGYWLIHCKFTCIAQMSFKHTIFPFDKANFFLKLPSQTLFSNLVAMNLELRLHINALSNLVFRFQPQSSFSNFVSRLDWISGYPHTIALLPAPAK